MEISNLLSLYLRDSADLIDSGKCSLSKEETEYLVSQIAHLEMNKTEAAEYLGMSIRTFDRKILDGELPEGLHIRGSKSLIWYKDELCNL